MLVVTPRLTHRMRTDGNVLRLPTQAPISNLGLSALSLVLSQIFRGKVPREPRQGRQSLWSSPPSSRQRKPLIPTVLLPASREELILQYSQPGLQRHRQQASQGFEYASVCSLLLSWPPGLCTTLFNQRPDSYTVWAQ